MLYICPCCNNRTVAWDPRCLHFVCLGDLCHQSFLPVHLAGDSFGETVMKLNQNRISDEQIQNWLNTCIECNSAPTYPSDELASQFQNQ